MHVRAIKIAMQTHARSHADSRLGPGGMLGIMVVGSA